MDESPNTTVFHYSSADNVQKILDDKQINQSPGGAFGEAAYFSKMHPREHSIDEIKKNNWDGRNVSTTQKVGACIEVRLPRDKVHEHVVSGRNIFTVTDNVNLNNYTHKAYNLENRKMESWNTVIAFNQSE